MRRLVIAVTVCALSLLGFAASASAALPWWNLNTSVRPAVIDEGGEATIVIRAANLGNASTPTQETVEVEGKQVPIAVPTTVTATMPSGVEILEREGEPAVTLYALSKSAAQPIEQKLFGFLALHYCQLSGQKVSCQTEPGVAPFNEGEFAGRFDVAPIAPYEYFEMRVRIKDKGAAPGATYTSEVSGGGTTGVSRTNALLVGSGDPPFGVEHYALQPEEEGGQIDARAGSHPYQLTTTFNLNQNADERDLEEREAGGKEVLARPPAMPRNLHFRLPPGQLGNATVMPKCSATDFATYVLGSPNICPPDTAIGVAVITIDEPLHVPVLTEPVPLFNLEPAFGEPARFGFELLGTPVILDTAVRSDKNGDYGVTVNVSNTTQLVNFISSTVTFWGTPGDPSHNNARGWQCLADQFWTTGDHTGSPTEPCESPSQTKPAAFLTLPTDCAAPFASVVEGDSWTSLADPERKFLEPFGYSLQEAGATRGLIGCNELPFAPSMQVEPSTDKASAPSGLDFNLNFNDEGLSSETGLAQSQLKDTVVTLPEGFTIDPSAGVGLGGCTIADYERESVSSAPGAGCPNDSKLGTVEIESPLLAQKIHGSLYIAQPYENPFGEPEHGHPGGTLVAIYIVAKNPETGILVKLAGKVTPNPVTGQLTTSFLNNPQLPFDHFNFHFREGAQAPLITPSTCGTYTVNAQLTPWSAPMTSLTDTSSFTITKGFDGGACPAGGVPPFSPGIAAGTLNNNGGAFTPFYLHLTRTDAEQEIAGFSTNMPPGLTGDLTGIPFCPEASIEAARQKTGAQEEAEPSCPASTQIGHTLVGTGVGAVLAYVPGKVYFAGPFHGAPFSIVSITSAVVGPFDLGTVVLRFGLSIDPNTAQVSVSPTSSESIPTIIDGIVTHVRDIRVYIDRPNFILNPTSCNPLSIASTLNSDLGHSVTVSSPFQDANCTNLAFKPAFKVSTSAKTSRRNGASLHVKLTYPTGALGKDANIRSVKVDLPKQLPSRLTTLQKACTAAQFNANPAGCPAASKVGYAKAITPLIPEPLQGPAYFVSHGGEAFPNLIIVLQGYGVTIHLVGDTFINEHTNITSSTFKTVPDQPVGSFELTLPHGPNSALAAVTNLCTVKGGLKMPTLFTAQNGATIKRSTPIAVTGCQKSHKKTKKKGRKAGRKAHGTG
jgi:hypothetical protein